MQLTSGVNVTSETEDTGKSIKTSQVVEDQCDMEVGESTEAPMNGDTKSLVKKDERLFAAFEKILDKNGATVCQPTENISSSTENKAEIHNNALKLLASEPNHMKEKSEQESESSISSTESSSLDSFGNDELGNEKISNVHTSSSNKGENEPETHYSLDNLPDMLKPDDDPVEKVNTESSSNLTNSKTPEPMDTSTNDTVKETKVTDDADQILEKPLTSNSLEVVERPSTSKAAEVVGKSDGEGNVSKSTSEMMELTTENPSNQTKATTSQEEQTHKLPSSESNNTDGIEDNNSRSPVKKSESSTSEAIEPSLQSSPQCATSEKTTPASSTPSDSATVASTGKENGREPTVLQKIEDPKGAPMVITVTMDKNMKQLKTAQSVTGNSVLSEAKAVQAKAAFNVKPPDGASSKVSAQDVKDGHAFLRPMPKFLYQLGLSLLREVVYEGLAEHVGGLRQKGDKKYSDDQYKSLQNSLATLRKENKPLKLEYDKVCKLVVDGKSCGFRTESQLALEAHLCQSHINISNRYVCARCDDYSCAVPAVFRNHMMEKHALMGVITKPQAFYQCKLCYYEANTLVRVQNHMASCAKSFQLSRNLKPDGLSNTPLGEGIFKAVDPRSLVKTVPPPKAPPLAPRQANPPQRVAPAPSPNPPQVVGYNAPQQVVGFKPASGTLQKIKLNSQTIFNRNITPAPAMPPQISTSITQIGGHAMLADVIPCEICGGYIQGHQALKVHMQWCHNINITHLKHPLFNCPNDTCKFKQFWTVQGLAKHSASCSGAKKVAVPDGTACFICSKPYNTSQVEHLLAKHLNDLKKMVELKRCIAPECRQYAFHTVDNLQAHLAKEHRLKMTGLSGLATANVSNIKFQPFCSICKIKFASSVDFARHCAETHVHKCDLCGAQCSTRVGLVNHETTVHPYRFCVVCDKQVKRSHYLVHVQGFHRSDKCRVTMKRMSSQDYDLYSKKPKLANWS